MQQQIVSNNNTSLTADIVAKTINNNFNTSPSLNFSVDYAHNQSRFTAVASNAKYEAGNHETTIEQHQFGTKNGINLAMTSSSYAQLPSGRNLESDGGDSTKTTASIAMAVHPFATLQRGSAAPTVRQPKPPALGTFSLRNSSLNTNDSMPFLKSRHVTTTRNENNNTIESKKNNNEDAEDEGQISRAHSLRDLASKFERISTNNGTTAALRNSIKLDEKRLFEPTTHHAAPTNENVGGMPTVSKDYLVELHRKLTGKLF